MTTKTQNFERRALRPKDAARAYSVSRTLLYEWMKSGRLKSVRIGGARLIPVEALETIISGAGDGNNLARCLTDDLSPALATHKRGAQ
jgi:excisionase family DNA binding protein